jgi:hypothetical protein
MDVHALTTYQYEMVTNVRVHTYLFSNVVLVPFQAVIPPPQLRRVTSEDAIHAVPNP